MPVISKGLEGIVANSTGLSDVLGEKGQLIYAGYDINELAGKVSFEEIVHLLWHGYLPNRNELTDLEHNLRSRRGLPLGVDRCAPVTSAARAAGLGAITAAAAARAARDCIASRLSNPIAFLLLSIFPPEIPPTRAQLP